MRKKDMRIERTQSSIKRAFLSLLETENYGKITIQDIADEAMINRNTFYLDYKDKDVLLKSIIDENMDLIDEHLDFKLSNDTKEDEIIILEKIAEALLKYRYFLKVMFSCTENKYFLERFDNSISKSIIGNHSFHFDNLDREYRETQMAFIISGSVGLIKYIASRGTTMNATQIAEMLYSLFFRPSKPETVGE